MNKINIFLFKPGNYENFGEYLCKQVIYKLGFDLNNYSNVNQITAPIDYIMTGIGGFLNKRIYDLYINKAAKWYVWGSGVHCIPSPEHRLPKEIIENKCIISLVRGPLTREYYNLSEDIPLGDAGYLTSYFFKITSSEKKNVFISHHYDDIIKPIDGVDIHLSAKMPPDSTGSFDKEFLYRLNLIANANIVLTSSMHVAIVCYSYGVPFAMVAKKETDLSKEWKWYDTLINMGITTKIRLVNSVEDGYRWWHEVKDQIKPISLQQQEVILNAFPFRRN